MDEDLDFATMSAYQLIEHLDTAYPHQCIQPNDTVDAARHYAGRRSLIDELVNAKAAEQSAREEE